MNFLVPRDSFFQDLFDFRRDFDQIFNRMLTDWPTRETRTLLGKELTFAPAAETYIDKDNKKYFCKISLPGIDPKDVQVHAQGNLLTITGERKINRTSKDVDFLDEEFAYGCFERTLTLPEGVQADKLNAEFVHGVLEITAPVTAALLPRKIEIKTSPMAKQMAA